MDEQITQTIERYVAGALTLVEAKVQVLAVFPACRKQYETLLLADYIEDQLEKVRRERLGAADAARDLCEVGMLERL